VISADVKFYIEFDEDSMPSSYTDVDYLTEVITEAVEDAMYDVGANLCGRIKVEVDGL
jgi:DNA-binding protein YbaB